MDTINASDFKARCLAILDRVSATGERVVILKRGRPVAELWPASHARAEYPQLELQDTVIIVGATLLTQDRRIVDAALADTLS